MDRRGWAMSLFTIILLILCVTFAIGICILVGVIVQLFKAIPVPRW